MKDKSIGLIILSYFPSFLELTVETKAFKDPMSTVDLVLPVLTAIMIQIFLWHTVVCIPTKHFIATIHRAMEGDYRARFSCDDINSNFKKLSCDFNQLMSCVESQTEELSENRILQNQLYENEKIYRSALELTCERIFEADLSHNRMVYGQNKYCKAFPFLHTEIYDEMINSLAHNAVFSKDTEKFYQTFSRSGLLNAFHKPGVSEVTLEYRLMNSNNQPAWYAASVVFLNSSGDENRKIIGYVKNIDERKKQELEILKQSQKDGLTGLYNKKVTQSLMEAFFVGEGREGKHAVIMVDIDNFKRINDTLGHSQGDIALMKIAQKIQSLFRSSDVAGRVGGDEFLILMKDISSNDILFSKLKSIGEYFSEIRLEDESYRISGSIGVSLYPDDGNTYETLFKKSDIALYYSKAHGKDQFYFYGGRFGEKYDTYDASELSVLDESQYVPRVKPIESTRSIKLN
ncbi:MAG TPA: GGDEF domain-containing protein [Caproicibacter sp.]|nr:GGDEF domain-containing protein [Caproicibacter sp.]